MDTTFKNVDTTIRSIPVKSEPMYQLGIDVCSMQKSEKGHVGFVLAVDYFSKWVIGEFKGKKLKKNVTCELCNHTYISYIGKIFFLPGI